MKKGKELEKYKKSLKLQKNLVKTLEKQRKDNIINIEIILNLEDTCDSLLNEIYVKKLTKTIELDQTQIDIKTYYNLQNFDNEIQKENENKKIR
jgi:hypothetical protein